MRQLLGFPRPNGGAGIRNYSLVVSTVHCANTLAQTIALQTDSHVITHDFGCADSHERADSLYRGLRDAAVNPNIAAVLVVGLGCEQTDRARLTEEIAASGKPVRTLSLQECGGFSQALEQGVAMMNAMKAEIADERQPVGFENLVIGVQCGGSDWTTALVANPVIGMLADRVVQHGGTVLMGECTGFAGSEHIIAGHAKDEAVGLAILEMCESIREDFKRAHGQNMSEINPSPGNKAGGITTLAEKSMGNVKKMGTTPIQGILRLGEKAPYPGLWLLNARTAGTDATTTSDFTVSGAVMGVFSTGRGTPLGNVAFPVVKLTGNPEAFKALPNILDFCAGDVLSGGSMDEVADKLFELVLEVAAGKETCSEINRCFEYILPREEG